MPVFPCDVCLVPFRRVVVCCCGRSGRRIEWIREVAPALTDSVCIPPFLLCYKTRAVFAAAGSEFALGSARTDDGWSVPSYPARDNPCVRAFLCLEDEKKLAVSCRLSERGFFSISFPGRFVWTVRSMLLSFEVRILRAPWLCSPASHVSLGVFVRRVVSAAVQAVRSPWEFPLMLTEFHPPVRYTHTLRQKFSALPLFSAAQALCEDIYSI